jgi:hypothetical protein
MKTMKLFKLAFEIYMIVSKKPIGLIVLLFIPCFAVCQNSVDSTTVIQDSSMAIGTDSLCSSRSVCNCDTVQQDSCLQQHRLSFINKGQKMTRDINPNALKMRKFDPYKKKFDDMQLIKIIGPHIRR